MNRWLFILVVIPDVVHGDTGIQLGPRAGIEIDEDVDLHVGGEVRIATPSSPVVIQPTFDYVFDEDQSLWKVGANVLYDLPIGGRIRPYAGVGFHFSAFTRNQNEPGVDGEGYRLGTSFIVGARIDLPRVSPYVQIAKSVGEFSPLIATAGISVSLRETRGALSPPEPMRFSVTPYLDNNVLGDVQSGRVGIGVSVGYRVLEHLGFEIDAEAHGHFFVDEDVADLVAPGVDLNTNALLFTASVVVPYCIRDTTFGTWCPYATAGAGVIHASFDGFAFSPGSSPFSETQNDPTLTGGVGITHAFTEHVGVRFDARYFHAFAASTDSFDQNYSFLRLSAGISAGF